MLFPDGPGTLLEGDHMAPQSTSEFAILRRRQVQVESGLSRSTIYKRVSEGLWPQPVKLGPRAVGWPAREVAALNEARIAGCSDAGIRTLVQKLESARSSASAA
jgi:prophage regulatory protein